MPTNNAWNSEDPAQVAKGGTGNATLTDHGVMLGSGTAPVTVTNPGMNGQVLIGATGADPAFASLTSTGGTIIFTPGANSLNLESVGGGVSIKVTSFTTSDTWTKDADAYYISVIGWNGGAGGGSGRRGASTSSGGGSAGASSGSWFFSAPANFFDATETVTIGSGGAGGSAQTVDTTNGNAGSLGGQTRFGNIGSRNQGSTSSIGVGGTTGSVNGGSAGSVLGNNNFAAIEVLSGANPDNGGNGSNTTGSTSLSYGLSNIAVTIGATSGGGGSGADSGTPRQAGNGGSIIMWNNSSTVLLAGGAGGIETGTINGANGNPGVVNAGGRILGGTGGGGGGGQSSGGSAGTGGVGGQPGGGGGGGGGSLNGTNSGAGGNGGDGQVIVIEYIS